MSPCVPASGAEINSGNLYVGRTGTGTLNIDNSGRVGAVTAFVGGVSGATGSISVTGTNSTWALSSNLYVGYVGGGAAETIDTLSVTAGGLVTNVVGHIGSGTGSKGAATITGADSRWTMTDDLYVGYQGTGTLTIQNGGVVSSRAGSIADNLAGVTSSATVDGTGSTWNTTTFLYVGRSGTGTLDIQAGGKVNGAVGHLGRNAGATGTATITGANSQLTLTSDFYIGGGTTTSGGTGVLNVRNGGSASNVWSYLGYLAGGNGTATVEGTGSQWTSSNGMIIGRSGTGAVNVKTGGLASANFGYIGEVAGSNGTLTVDGTDARWTATGILVVGRSGTGTLEVKAGGVVSNAFGYVGDMSGSNGTATVTGAGSQWNNNVFFVGQTGTGSLTISAGGKVASWDSYIGRFTGAIGTATVTGANSLWELNGIMMVGGGGTAAGGTGTLTVSAGGKVTSGDGYLGRLAGGNGTVNVTGTGSQWTSDGILFVGGGNGASGGTGTLNILSGGVVGNLDGNLAYLNGSVATVTVDGTGSQWNNSGALTVGRAGTGTLNVQNGGFVTSANAFVGSTGSGIGIINVSGTGSQWSYAALNLGSNTTGQLTISAGGKVTAGSNTFLGAFTGSSGTATVTGAGSQWNAAGQFSVGAGGTGVLKVEAGGVVSSGTAGIATATGSSGTATLTGAGSQWTSSGGLYVGGGTSVAGGTGSLTVSDGGFVSVAQTLRIWSPGTLTLDGGSITTFTFDRSAGTFDFIDGTLTVDGGTYLHSTAVNMAANILFVNGLDGSDEPILNLRANGAVSGVQAVAVGSTNHGTLQVTGGRMLTLALTPLTLDTVGTTSISRGSGYVGVESFSRGTSLVSGIGSHWNLSGDLHVGVRGEGILEITDGGRVSSVNGYITSDVFGTGTVSVTGTNARWNVSSALVLSQGFGNSSLTIGTGGTVAATGTATLKDLSTLYMQTGGTISASSLSLTGGTINYSGGTISAPVTIDRGNIVVASGAVLPLANITGTGFAMFTKSGAGRLDLTGNNGLSNIAVDGGSVTLSSTGTVSGRIEVGPTSSAAAHAAGTIGALDVWRRGTFSPGTDPDGVDGGGIGMLSTARAQWEDGARIGFDFARTDDGATTSAITNWDVLRITSSQGLTLSSTARYTIELRSWTDAGDVYGENTSMPFDPMAEYYSWLFVDNVSTGAISGFNDADPMAQFVFDRSHFYPAGGSNAELMSRGTFWVSRVGSDLYVNYSGVPEPSSLALIGVTGLGFVARRFRKRKQARTTATTVVTKKED